MRYYKELLLKKLSDSGWELIEEDDGAEWWLESWWKIRSISQSYGHVIYIVFLVDPQYEGENKSKAVIAVGASQNPPDIGWSENEEVVTEYMTKGKIESRLAKFVERLNKHRDELRS